MSLELLLNATAVDHNPSPSKIERTLASTWAPPERLRQDRDFLRRFGIGETIKQELRRQYARACRATRGEPRERFLSRSLDFWSMYESINLLYIPEDPVYNKPWTGITLTTTNSVWEWKSPAAGQIRILESYVGGEAAASTVLRAAISRVNAEGTGTTPTVYTANKFNTRSPAAASTIYGALAVQVAWGTLQETLFDPLILQAFNAFGGTDRWVPQPGEEIYLVNAEEASWRSLSGTPVTSGHVIAEEL